MRKLNTEVKMILWMLAIVMIALMWVSGAELDEAVINGVMIDGSQWFWFWFSSMMAFVAAYLLVAGGQKS